MKVHKKTIDMSCILPGRLSEGEAFLHPDFFKILSLIRKKYPFNTLHIFSNCLSIDRQFINALSKFRPVSVTASIHSTDPEKWAEIFNRSVADAKKTLKTFSLFREFKISLKGSIVPLPGICTWYEIGEVVSFLVEQGAESLSFFNPGYTDFTPSEIVDKIICPLEDFTEYIQGFKSRNTLPVFPFPDLKGSLNIPVEKIVRQTLEGNRNNGFGSYEKVIWLVSEAVYPRLETIFRDQTFPNKQIIFPVKNRSYGGNVIVSGLLGVSDFIYAGKEAIEKYKDADLFLVPAAPFDFYNFDLFHVPAYKISEALNRRVWIVSGDGEVNSLLSDKFIVSEQTGLKNTKIRQEICREI